jgi:hypothetical protein
MPGRGRSNAASIKLKMAVFAAMPKPRATMMTMPNQEVRRSARNVEGRSVMMWRK